jgi:1,4-dihydroxy-2-naphthoate octaprenyltransferase
MIAAGPVVFLGWFGLVSPALLAIFVRNHFIYILKADLLPEHRIPQMQHISKANLFGNGAMVVAMAVTWIMRLIIK